MTIRSLLGITLALVGCAGEEVVPSVPVGAPVSDLPSLRLHHTSSRLENSPTGLGTQFVVAPNGMVVLSDVGSRDMLYLIIDTAGEVIRRAGQYGEGPGEVRGGKLIVTDSGFVVASERLVQFSFDGVSLKTTSLSYASNPRTFVAPGSLLDVIDGSPRGHRIGLTSLDGGRFRQLVSNSDTFVVSNFGLPPRPGGGTRNPTIGVWTGGFIVGDGWTYRLALYDWQGVLVRVIGREIKPPLLSPSRLERNVALTVRSLRAAGRRMDEAAIEKVRNSSASAEQRHFGFFNPTGLDARGRIWVLGIEGDSGFADVFNHEQLLGRLSLPCPGFSHGWSLAGRWLVLACMPEDEDSILDAVFKVFTIEET